MNLLSKREAANRLSVSVSTIERMMLAGELRVWRRGRIVRIPEEDVSSLVRNRTIATPSCLSGERTEHTKFVCPPPQDALSDLYQRVLPGKTRKRSKPGSKLS